MLNHLIQFQQYRSSFRWSDGLARYNTVLRRKRFQKRYFFRNHAHGTEVKHSDSIITFTQDGILEYVPVVNTSIAAGIWKLGNRARTTVSRAILASWSAVSTNSIDWLSNNPIMTWTEDTIGESSSEDSAPTLDASTYSRFIHFGSAISPFHQSHQPYE